MLVPFIMLTSSNGNIFCVTGPLCGEFTGEHKVQWPVVLMFSFICAWMNSNEYGGCFSVVYYLKYLLIFFLHPVMAHQWKLSIYIFWFEWYCWRGSSHVFIQAWQSVSLLHTIYLLWVANSKTISEEYKYISAFSLHAFNSLARGRPWCDLKNVIFNLALLISIFKSSYDNVCRWMTQDFTDD